MDKLLSHLVENYLNKVEKIDSFDDTLDDCCLVQVASLIEAYLQV